MRTKNFEVPTDLINEFADALGEHSFNNAIQGTNENGDIIITVEYDQKKRAAVLSLSEMIDDYNEENEEESEEESE